MRSDPFARPGGQVAPAMSTADRQDSGRFTYIARGKEVFMR